MAEDTWSPGNDGVAAFDWASPASGRVVAGPDALARLPGLLSDLGVSRVVLVTSPSMSRSAIFGLAREQVGDRLAGVHPTVTPHTPMEDVRSLRDSAVTRGADCYVAIGGSSVIDAMKAAVWLDRDGAKPRAVAVPATFGGAEVTPRAGVTDSGEKTGLTSERIVPDAVVLDPRVPAALPPGSRTPRSPTRWPTASKGWPPPTVHRCPTPSTCDPWH
ncbi:iron-containing alcohol dehydrogenase [Thermocatellispora tengchongensis]|uniref:iron-containing alcohol dehydrogenase n=1 Tax=Thermocatellispora tengchongensis TaxID=1073253 RepID=UPI00362B4702